MRVAFRHAVSVPTPRPNASRLTVGRSVPSPSGMGFVRRAGLAAALAAAPLGLAYRFALAYRARAGYPRQHPPAVTPGRPRAARSRRPTVRSGDIELPAWFIPARGGQPGPGRRPRPRLGVRPRPDAAERRLPPRRRVPLPDDRRPRPRRQPARDAADQRRRVRARRAGDLRGACSPARRSPVGAVVGHSMGAIGAILAGGRGPTRRRRRRHVRPGRSAPADPPDVPPRPPADPGRHRLSARLADDAGLPRAARPPRRGGLARPRPSPATAARSCSPTATPTRSSRRRTWTAWPRPRARTPDRRTPRRSRRWSCPAASTRGCTRTRPIGRPSPASWPRPSAGRSHPTEAAAIAAATPAERIPDGEHRFAAVERHARRLPGPGRRRPTGCAARHRPDPGARRGRRSLSSSSAGYCQRNLPAAIPKHTTSQPRSTAAHTYSGANAAPPTITWRSASAR